MEMVENYWRVMVRILSKSVKKISLVTMKGVWESLPLLIDWLLHEVPQALLGL